MHDFWQKKSNTILDSSGTPLKSNQHFSYVAQRLFLGQVTKINFGNEKRQNFTH